MNISILVIIEIHKRPIINLVFVPMGLFFYCFLTKNLRNYAALKKKTEKKKEKSNGLDLWGLRSVFFSGLRYILIIFYDEGKPKLKVNN